MRSATAFALNRDVAHTHGNRRTQETMIVRGPARHGRLVEPDGLAALRLALAMARDPLGGDLEAGLAFRSLPRPRNNATGGGAGTSAGAVAIAPPPATTTVAPPIPVPNAPSEPTGELATVMDIV